MQMSMVWRFEYYYEIEFISWMTIQRRKKNYAYRKEFAALNGFARREFLWLRLFFRLNDMRLRNWRKSKLRIVSMVDGLQEMRRKTNGKHVKKVVKIYLKSIICEKLFEMMLTNRLIYIPMIAAAGDGMLHSWRWWNVTSYRHSIHFPYIQWIGSQWWFFQRHTSK